VVEDGSDVAADLWGSDHPVASSVLFYPEGRAALAAARRAGRLTAAGHRRALEEFEPLRRELTVIGVDEELAEQAGHLAAELGLRGYDAVHLASAVSLGDEATVLVTWDRALADGAGRAGLAVAPAE
jgi:uncharacterized protein